MSGNQWKREVVNELSMEGNIDVNQEQEDTLTDEHDADNFKFENRHEESCNSNNDEDVDVNGKINVFDNHDNDCHVQQAIHNNEAISMDNILVILENYPLEVQHQNKLGYYPLHTACRWCRSNNSQVMMLLIQLFPKAAHYKTLEGHSPLHLSMRNADISEDVIMKLIDIFPKAVIEATATDETSLLFLALSRYYSSRVIAKLIEINPLLLQEQNDKDEYPIHRAVIEYKSIEIITLLLDGDSLGMERRYGVSCEDGSTPLHLACKMNHADLVQCLLRRSDLQINVRDGIGKTPLHIACNHHNKTIVEMILKHPDVNVNAIDWCYSDTPLHITLRTKIRITSGTYDISYCPPEKLVDIIQILLNHPFILINEKNYNNIYIYKTPLDMIQDRLNELNDRNDDNRTSFEKVQYQCYIKIIYLLNEFNVKQRYQSYCYHNNMLKDLYL